MVNHTSDGHPWFRRPAAARTIRTATTTCGGPTEPKSGAKDVVFPGQEDSIWEFDPQTGRVPAPLLQHQPDLNTGYTEVLGGFARLLSGWNAGCGFSRRRPVPVRHGLGAGRPGAFDANQYLGDIRNFVTRRLGDAVLLGEVNLPYKDQLTFFGGPDGDGLNMQFDFIGMQAMYLSLARGDAGPIADALRQRPALDTTGQWANFVRNHDELTLDKLSDDERQEVFDAFGPEPDMQLYGRGLRRRLPSMLGGDDRRMRMVYSLMFSLPGTPVLFYGEEIGMAENLDVPGRLLYAPRCSGLAARMAASPTHRSGGSPVPLPDGLFGPQRINAADQRHDHQSFWWFIRNLIYTYRSQPEIGWSTPEILEQPNPGVLAHVCREKSGWAMVALHNFGLDGCIVPIQLKDAPPGSVLVDLLDGLSEHALDAKGRIELRLEADGYRWLRLLPPEDDPII